MRIMKGRLHRKEEAALRYETVSSLEVADRSERVFE